MLHVARYAARRVPVDDVQDVVAETFTTAWRRLDHVPEDGFPWLVATARNVISNRRRATIRDRALDRKLSVLPTWTDTGPREPIDGAVIDAIRNLPELEREAIMLVAWEGLEGRRAARAAGCSEAAFRVRVHRARKRLRRQIAGKDAPLRMPQVRDRLEELS